MDCETRPVSTPFTGTARGARRTLGVDQPPCVAPARRQLRCGAMYRSHGGGGEPSDWSRAAGNPARTGRAVCSINAWRFFATTPSRDTTRPREIPGHPRSIRWFPKRPTQCVLDPAPRWQPGRRSTRLLPSPDLVAPLAVRFQRPENGPCFTFHPSGFPCAYAGSDGCPGFTRETSPVKSCGLYTDAALRGRLVPLEEVHLAEIQA